MEESLKLLKEARNKLLDLTLRNPLLNFNIKKANRLITINPSINSVYLKLLSEKIEILPMRRSNEENLPEVEQAKQLGINTKEEASDDDEPQADPRIQTLHYIDKLDSILSKKMKIAKAVENENGENMLFVVIGFLKWKQTPQSDKTLFAPLLTVPIRIVKQFNKGVYSYFFEYTGEDMVPNISLQYKIKQEFGVEIPSFGGNETPKDYLLKVENVCQHREELIGVSKRFALDIFQFNKLRMYLDLDDGKWLDGRKPSQHPIIASIAGDINPNNTSTGVFGGEKVCPSSTESIKLVLDADGSQREAIAKALNGQSMVIEGPPGTGKSQTIANLIAVAMSEGKSVLFVAEKLVALEVVKKRLDNVGLGNFILELHSHKTNKASFYLSLKNRIDMQASKAAINIDNTITEIENLKIDIKNYIEALHSPIAVVDKTPFEIFGNVEKYFYESYKEAPSYINFSMLDKNAFEETQIELKTLARILSDNPQISSSCWNGFTIRNAQGVDIPKIEDVLKQLKNYLSETMSKCQTIVGQNKPEKSFFESLEKLASSSLLTRRPDFDVLSSAISLEGCNVDDILMEAEFLAKSNMSLTKLFKTNISPNIDKLQKLKDELSTLLQNDQVHKLHNVILSLRISPLKLSSELQKLYSAFFVDKFFDNAPTGEELEKVRLYQVDDLEAIFGIIKNILSYGNFIEKVNLTDHNNLESIESLSLKTEKIKDISFFKKFFNKEYKACKQDLRQLFSTDAINLLEGHEQITILLSNIERLNGDIRSLSRRRYVLQTNFTMQNKLSAYGPFLREIKNFLDYERVFIWVRKSEQLFSTDILNIIYNNDSRNKLSNLKSIIAFAKKSNNVFEKYIKLIYELSIIFKLDNLNMDEISHVINKAIDDTRSIKEYFDKLPALNMNIFSDLDYSNFEKNIVIFNEVAKLNSAYIWKNQIYAIDISDDIKNGLLKARGYADSLLKLHTEIKPLLSNIELHMSEFGKFGIVDRETFFNSSSDFEKQKCAIERKINSLGELWIWIEYSSILRSLQQKGLRDLLRFAAQKGLKSKLQEVFLYSFYREWANKALQGNQYLANFGRSSFEEKIKKFSELDAKLSSINAVEHISNLLRKQLPDGINGNANNRTEMFFLRHETTKQTKHLPIRQALNRAFNSILALKPCFMMSPLSVSQFVSPEHERFDMVIIDEASQILPEDAIGTILRGKQIIVVGDQKQLPPTSFFSLNSEDEDNEEETVVSDSESILDLMLRTYPNTKRLKWHYRSKHESLIAFSNKYFYDNELMVFPSPSNSVNDNGIYRKFIANAYFKNRYNQIEAKAIVADAIKHLKTNHAESLGIVVMNKNQAEYIDGLLEEEMKNNEELGSLIGKAYDKNMFFVKNLENVQGDEADCLFIGTTYAPDFETRQVYQRFGPINSANGWRRINVLVTRAKNKIVLFTSLKSSDILDSAGNRSRAAFKNYIKYAETGKLDNVATNSCGEPDSPFEESVIDFIKSIGYEACPQVGVSGFYIDIGVKVQDISEYIIGIECDGASYHSSKSARDRDRLRQTILENMGWNIYRIWSTDWFRNKAGEQNRLKVALNKAKLRYQALNTSDTKF